MTDDRKRKDNSGKQDSPETIEGNAELALQVSFRDVVAEAREHVDRSQELADRAMIQLGRRTEELEDANRKIAVAHEQAERELKERQDAVRELDQARIDAERGAEELADARLAVLKAREQRDYTLEQLSERTRMLESLTREKSITQTLLDEERERAQQEIAQMKAEVVRVKEEARAAIRRARKESKPRHVARVEALRRAITKLSTRVEAETGAREAAERELAEIRARIDEEIETRTKEARAEVEAERKDIEARLEEARKEGRAGSAEEIMKIRNQTEATISALREETAAQLSAADAELEAGLKEQRRAAAAGIRIAREEGKAEVENVRQDLEEKLSLARSNADRLGSQLEAETRKTEDLTAKLDRITKELESARARAKQAEADRSSLTEEIEAARADAQAARREAKPRAARQIAQLKIDLAETREKLGEARRGLQRLDKAEAGLARAHGETAALARELSVAREQLADAVDARLREKEEHDALDGLMAGLAQTLEESKQR